MMILLSKFLELSKKNGKGLQLFTRIKASETFSYNGISPKAMKSMTVELRREAEMPTTFERKSAFAFLFPFCCCHTLGDINTPQFYFGRKY